MSEQAQPIDIFHHERYYFDDEMSIFLVEDRLFKVHRYFLTQGSDLFRMMFASPPPPDGKDGVSDDRPIYLPEVKVQEFERLLDFFYLGAFRSDDGLLFKSEAHKSTARDYTYVKGWNSTFFEQWIDLLSIATRFDFQQVRSHAIRAIEERKPSLEPIRQIVLSVKFDIPQWLKPALESLCQRDDPLQVDEAEKIGLRYSILLAQAREQFREHLKNVQAHKKSYGVPTSRHHDLPYDPELVAGIIRNVFFPHEPEDSGHANWESGQNHTLLTNTL